MLRGMTEIVVGRAEELNRIDVLWDDVVPHPTGLLLDGEAGIGKTSIWCAGVAGARARGLIVLVARPAERERALPYSALADLLEPALEKVDELPVPLRHALDSALQRTASDEPAHQLAVSRAVLAVIRALAVDRPVVVAVDDVQWLDPPTENTLAFVVRRVSDMPVRILIARRSDSASPPPLELERALARFTVVSVAPLSLSDLDRLLRTRLGVHLPRPRLAQLHRACSGNPLHALEIARSLDATNSDGDLSIPAELTSVLRRRLDALPPSARDTVLLAAACIQPTPSLVRRAAAGGDGLTVAREHDVLRIERGRLRFAHPLLASSAYATATAEDRRDAHARLAGAADTAYERAHHLAHATDEPDEEIAAELERAATAAAGRGGSEAAADLAEHAARLTPQGSDEWHERRLTAARYRLTAGDPEGARAALESLIASLPAGPRRAEALASLADVVGAAGPDEAMRLCLQALDEAAGDPALSANIHLGLATFTWNSGAIARSAEHARESVRLAEEVGDRRLLAISLGDLFQCETMLGLLLSDESAAKALALQESLESLPASTYSLPRFQLGIVYTATDRLPEARSLLVTELERVTASGDEAIRWGVHCRLSDLELRAGNLAEALQHAQMALDLVRLLDYPVLERFALAPYAAAAAHIGDVDAARAAALTVLEQSEESGNRMTAVRARGTLGFVELSLNRAAEAWDWLAPAVDDLIAMEAGELSIFGVAQNAIDALVGLGRLDEATSLIDWVDEKGRPAARSWHRAVAARGRALVAASRGDHAAAQVALDAALAAHATLPQPFELARTLLAQGAIERRAKHRASARQTLTRALELFDELGAARWAEQAAAELARIPGRGPASSELTETERRVAELVVTGLSNKEVAARLFVTVRTVEANLSKVYAKLGVRSRTELANRLGRRDLS